MKNTLLIIIISLIFAVEGRAKISSKKALKNLVDDCTNEEVKGLSLDV